MIDILQAAYRIELSWRLATRWRTRWAEMSRWTWLGALEGAS